MNVSGDLTFGDIEMYARPRAKLSDYVRKGWHILYGVCDKCAIVGILFTGQYEATRGDVVAFLRGRELAN